MSKDHSLVNATCGWTRVGRHIVTTTSVTLRFFGLSSRGGPGDGVGNGAAAMAESSRTGGNVVVVAVLDKANVVGRGAVGPLRTH